MVELSLASMDRIIRRVGNERVSKDAAIELRAIIESEGEKIAEEAIREAENEGIKTIKERHIREAAKKIREEI